MFARPQLAPVKSRADVLQDSTVREFSGGWNVVDNDLNLSTRFSTVLDNMSREEDGSMGVRWGTKLMTSFALTPPTRIVNITYFQDSVIVVFSDGLIRRVLGNGTTTLVWNTSIAAGLVGAPPAWGPTDFASFAVFNGKLIVCNGTDKPLLADFTKATKPVIYLADEATGTNVRVPICRYVVAMNKYVVMAGDPLHPDRVHISNQNTSGTWFGDAAPNDATYVDLGKVGVQGEQAITGINRYRDQLVVSFFNASVLGKLGIYTGEPPVHAPDFNDVVEGFGGHSHRCMVNLGNDLFMLDNQGITSIAKSLYSGSTEPKRVSELIDPEVNRNVNRLLEADTLLGAHAVYNNNDKQYMCFVPNHSQYARDMIDNPFEVVADRRDVLRAHIPYHDLDIGDQFTVAGATNWNDVVAATKLNGITHTVTRVVDASTVEFKPPALVTDANKAIMGGGTVATWTPQFTETTGYIYTFINELKIRAWARFRNWKWRASCRSELGSIIFADDKRLFVLGSQNNPLHSDFIGTPDEAPIAFQWELPWADFDRRVNVKHIRYIQLDTRGTAMFTMMMFADELYKFEGVLLPCNIMNFVGGDAPGFGGGVQEYGGGTRTRTQRLYAWVAHGKLFKVRFQGVTSESLRIVALSLMYQNGSIRR